MLALRPPVRATSTWTPSWMPSDPLERKPYVSMLPLARQSSFESSLAGEDCLNSSFPLRRFILVTGFSLKTKSLQRDS